jgi:uncharacterized protein
MIFPQLTAAYGGVLALLFAALSAHVVALRGQTNIVHGDGGHDGLNRVIRAHANFAEYVPLILVLVALLEAGGGSATAVHGMLLPLLVARLMHPVGMQMPVGSRAQYLWRATSATVTWVVLIAAGVLLLNRSL